MILDLCSKPFAQVVAQLHDLVLEDPATHTYALYDLVYEPHRSRLIVNLENDRVVGYVLRWCGRGACAVHVWGDVPMNIVDEALREAVERGAREIRTVYIHIHSPGLEELVKGVAREVLGGFSEHRFLDMVVDRASFRPSSRDVEAEIRVLDPERDAEAFAELRREHGRGLTLGECVETLRNCLYVGAFVGSELASMAGAIVRLRDAWIVADVYTRPKYRGRGLGTAVTSRITELAFIAGAKKVALHVHEQNEIAKRIYEKLGYRVTAKKLWLVYRP